jgi:Ca-activated chloride channel family protein
VTKLNRASLEAIAKATKGGYVNGNNTKVVLEYIKTNLDKIQKQNLNRHKSPIFSPNFNGSLESHLFVVFRFLLVGKRTKLGS